MTASSILNNFRKLEKQKSIRAQRVQRIVYYHQRQKHLAVLNQLQKRRQSVYII